MDFNDEVNDSFKDSKIFKHKISHSEFILENLGHQTSHSDFCNEPNNLN